MERVLRVIYSQRGTREEAHKFSCTVDGITINHVQSSHSCMTKLNRNYITKEGRSYFVPDLSAATDEEIFQLSLISDIPMDIKLLHEVQKYMVHCYNSCLFRRSEFTLEY